MEQQKKEDFSYNELPQSLKNKLILEIRAISSHELLRIPEKELTETDKVISHLNRYAVIAMNKAIMHFPNEEFRYFEEQTGIQTNIEYAQKFQFLYRVLVKLIDVVKEDYYTFCKEQQNVEKIHQERLEANFKLLFPERC